MNFYGVFIGIDRYASPSINMFVDEVAANRKLDTDKVAALADGRTYVGTDAVSNGLIDGIGSIPEASDYLTQQIGEQASVCWY
ncbi:MAG: S49 family peptidase [bacterium]